MVFLFVAMLHLDGAIVGGMLSGLVKDNGEGDEKEGPPGLLVLFLFVVVFVMEVFAVMMVRKAIRKCRGQQPHVHETERDTPPTPSSSWTLPSLSMPVFQSSAPATYASTGTGSSADYNRMDVSSSTSPVNVWGRQTATTR